ncbi:MAG TPA: energy transducer TonB [Acidobacteriaceae bacterium]|nr:energy transducer TonB [Acidobacteriaceae bacterium]
MHFISTRKAPAIVLAIALAVCCALPAAAAGRKVEHRVAPVYPELARRMHIGGVVRIVTTIAADGTVTKTKAVRGNNLLTPAAEKAIRRWKFAPSDGPSRENIDISFVEKD